MDFRNKKIEPMATKKKAAKTYRSAETGRKVTKEFAKANPKTTISETVKKKKA